MVVLSIMTAFALSAGLPAPSLAEPGPTIAVRADRGEVSQAGTSIRAEGGVVLQSGDLWLRADELQFDQATGQVSARGNLGLVDGNLVLEGQAASLNLSDPDTLKFEGATLFQKESPVSPKNFADCARTEGRGDAPTESTTAPTAQSESSNPPPSSRLPPAPPAETTSGQAVAPVGEGAPDVSEQASVNAASAPESETAPEPKVTSEAENQGESGNAPISAEESSTQAPADSASADAAPVDEAPAEQGTTDAALPSLAPEAASGVAFSEEERRAWREADDFAACQPGDLERLGQNALRLDAESIERRGNAFHARSLKLTSCSCAGSDCPAWSLGASTASVEPGEGALLWWPTFRIRDVPVLIFPALYIPLSPRRTGLLFPKVEFASGGGLGVDLPFFLTLGQSYDLTFTLGFLTKPLLSLSSVDTPREHAWGPRGSIEFRYAPTTSTSGRVKLSMLLDRGFETADADRERRGPRGELVARHRSRFAHGLGLFADIAAVSDARYLTDLSDNLLAGATPYLQSSLRGFWRQSDFELTLATGWFQDLIAARSAFFPSESPLIGPNSPASYQRPALFLAQMPLRRLVGRLQIGADLLVSHLRPIALGGSLTQSRLMASIRSSAPADFFALTRVDLAPRLYLPLLRRGPLRAELTAGARGDFSAYTPVLSGEGETWTDLWARAYADLRLSTELSRVFNADSDERALRHTISPSLQLRASTREFGTRDDELDLDDALDAIDALVIPLDELDATSRAASPRQLQGVAAVRTRLSRRNGQELVALTLGQGFDFTRMKWSESFAQVRTGFRWVAASVGARFDPELRALSLIQGKLRLMDPRGDYLSVSYDLLRGSGTSLMRSGLDDLLGELANPANDAQFQQINVGVGVVIVRGFALGYGIRIDPVAADSADRVLLHSASIRLKGSCDCWGLDLGAEWAPVSERWSGKILFTLKNLGSFGN